MLDGDDFDPRSLEGQSFGPNGRYGIVRYVGRGATAVVFEARDEDGEGTVALKFYKPMDGGSSEQFRRFTNEIRKFSHLDHPTIVPMKAMGFGTANGLGKVIYLAGEYVHGRTLLKILRDAVALAPKHAIGVARALADALVYLHSVGVIHRDLKPSNVMIEKKTKNVRLLDFGIAKDLNAQSVASNPGFAVMTAGYASPEQTKGGEIDGRSDLYSLGVVLVEMLCGALPKKTLIADEHAARRADDETIDPADRLLLGITVRLLRKHPRDRFPDAKELLSALDRARDAFADRPVEAAPEHWRTLFRNTLDTVL